MPKETELTALQSKDPLSSSTTTNPLVKTEEKVEAEQIPEGLWYKEHALGHCKVNLKPKYIKIDEEAENIEHEYSIIWDEVLDEALQELNLKVKLKMGDETTAVKNVKIEEILQKLETMAVTIDSVNSKFYCNTIKANDDCWYLLIHDQDQKAIETLKNVQKPSKKKQGYYATI